jgi:hypothetical protein
MSAASSNMGFVGFMGFDNLGERGQQQPARIGGVSVTSMMHQMSGDRISQAMIQDRAIDGQW